MLRLWKQSTAVAAVGAMMLAICSTASAQAVLDKELVMVRGASQAGLWIGLQTEPVSDVLRSHLKLKEGEGIVVVDVVPDSPGAKAGIQRHDILLKVGDEPLGDVAKLLQMVNDAEEGKPLELTLLRAGQRRELEVTPGKRPAEFNLPIGPGKFGGSTVLPPQDAEQLRKWAEELQQALKDRAAAHGRQLGELRFFHPGVMTPGLPPSLPENLTVAITRQGKEPAKIKVQRGDESWETTEDHLDKLPEDIRPHVAALLGGAPSVLNFKGGTLQLKPGAAGVRVARPEPPAQASREEGETARALDRVLDRLEKMESKIDDLERRLPKKRSTEKPGPDK